MPYSATSAAATSSCVLSGFDAQSAMSAPPSRSAIIRFAVSVVTCRHAAMRSPFSGFSFAKRARICSVTGISRAAHSMRRTPSSASRRSRTSCLIVSVVNCVSFDSFAGRLLRRCSLTDLVAAYRARYRGRIRTISPPLPRPRTRANVRRTSAAVPVPSRRVAAPSMRRAASL